MPAEARNRREPRQTALDVNDGALAPVALTSAAAAAAAELFFLFLEIGFLFIEALFELLVVHALTHVGLRLLAILLLSLLALLALPLLTLSLLPLLALALLALSLLALLALALAAAYALLLALLELSLLALTLTTALLLLALAALLSLLTLLPLLALLPLAHVTLLLASVGHGLTPAGYGTRIVRVPEFDAIGLLSFGAAAAFNEAAQRTRRGRRRATVQRLGQPASLSFV